jgi:hypothetical protein
METPSQLLTSLRDYLDEPTEGYWKNSELVGRLSDSHKRIARTITSQDPTFFIASTNIDFVANQALYDLPRNARLGSRWEHASKNDANGNPQGYVYDMRLRDRVIGDQIVIGNNSLNFSIAFQGAKIRVSPIPTAAQSNAITLFYTPIFADLHEGFVSAATSTTITFPASPTFARTGSPSIFNDDYNGMDVIIKSGTGVGQRRTITAYTGGSTLQATVATWDTTPDTSSVYAIVSPVPDDFHDLIALDAVITASSKSTRRRLQQYAGIYQDRLQEMINWVDQRQVFAQDHVIPDFSAGVY